MIFDFLSKLIGFQPARLKVSTGPVVNPSRGWYQIFYFHIPQQPDFQQLRWCLRENEPMAMAVVDIGRYRSGPLDPEALDAVDRLLDFFQQHEKDLILRFTYDCEGKGLAHEPALFSQVEEHIRQLAPLVRAYTKTIFVLQGLFIGSWGEMHGSRFLSSMHLRQLNALVESAAGAYTYLAARKPCQWRVIHGPEEWGVRMGLFDDGIFGSASNLGSFGHIPRNQTKWENPWCPEDELAFEEELCAIVPHGGEVIHPPQPGLAHEEILRRLRRMRISYLNCAYDGKLLDAWKNMDSPWPGVNLYDYVGAHLGYRFVVQKVSARKKNNQRLLNVAVANTGFAPCYEDCILTLELVTADGSVLRDLPWDIRTVMPGDTVKWQFAIPETKGALYLTVRRMKDGRVLRFANESETPEKLYLGQLI